jgi:hypothetical protein
MLQAGRSRVRIIGVFNWSHPTSRNMALGSTQLLTEMSTRNLTVGKGRSARKADNFIAICEPIFYKMWQPWHLTIPWASTACYMDSFTLSFLAVSFILSSDRVATGRFRIDDWIYWTLWHSAWLHFTIAHTVVSTVTSSLPLLISGLQWRTFLLVCGFTNYPRPQLPVSHSNGSQKLILSSSLLGFTHYSYSAIA